MRGAFAATANAPIVETPDVVQDISKLAFEGGLKVVSSIGGPVGKEFASFAKGQIVQAERDRAETIKAIRNPPISSIARPRSSEGDYKSQRTPFRKDVGDDGDGGQGGDDGDGTVPMRARPRATEAAQQPPPTRSVPAAAAAAVLKKKWDPAEWTRLNAARAAAQGPAGIFVLALAALEIAGKS